MILSRLAAFVAALAVALTLAAGGAVAPAFAATEAVLLSRDGITFTPALSGGLFDGAGKLVPGQSIARSLWIRNPSAGTAALRVSIRNLAATSTVFASGVTLTSVDSLPGSIPVTRPLSTLGTCDVVGSVKSLPPGGTVKLTLTFTMADLTDQLAASDRASLDLMIALRDAAAGAFSGSACGDGGTLLADTSGFRTVAFTGGSVPIPLIIAGGALLGSGIFVILARRRRQSEDD